MLKRISAVIIGLIIISAAVCPLTAFAAPDADGTDFMSLLRQPDARAMCVAFRGDVRSWPENSLEAVRSAAELGADASLVDVAKTRDGVLIAFADATTERTCAGDKVYSVADSDWAELKELRLKTGFGGRLAETDCRIPTLGDLLAFAAEENAGLVLKTAAELLPDVAAALADGNMLGKVAVAVYDSAKNLKTALDGCADKPVLIGGIRSNVIFTVRGYEKTVAQLGGAAVVLKTTNRYGVNFYKSHLDRLSGSLRAVADLSDTETAGWRTDCEQWWDDLISRGYSVIITNEVRLFTEYLRRTDEMRAELESALAEALAFRLPVFKKETFNDYKKAYDDAVSAAKKLTADKTSSYNDMSVACADIRNALTALNLNYDSLEEGTAGLNISAKSVILCVFAAALVVSAQIYVFKKRKGAK